MTRTDKKNKAIIRAITFVIVVVLLFAYIEAISYNDKVIYEGWRYVYRDEIDVLIMGSSHAHCSFDAQYITDKSGKSTIVLSSGAQNIEQTYYNLVEVLRYQKPDLIIIESFSVIEDTIPWMKETGVVGLALENLDGMKMSFHKLKSSFMVVGFDGYGVFQIMREAGKTSRLTSAIINIKSRTLGLFNPIERKLDSQRGFEPMKLDAHVNDQEYARKDQSEIDYNFQLPTNNIKYMEKVIKLCNENDIVIEFMLTPKLKNEVANSGNVALVKYLHDNNYDIDTYNLMTGVDDLELLQADYGDINHVSPSGAAKVSQFFVEHLEEYYENK